MGLKEWSQISICFRVFPGWVYVIEMALKVMVYGFHNYWRSTQNRFDFVITVTIGQPLVLLFNKTRISFMLMIPTSYIQLN